MANTQGFLMFAHNNREIDYFKIAVINALMIQKNTGSDNVSVVTDQGTYDWAKQSLGEELLTRAFDKVIVEERDYVYQEKNPRQYRDTVHHVKKLPFYNCDHFLAYELTPYKETIFLDADYLVMSDSLNRCWGSSQDVMICHKTKEMSASRKPLPEHIDPFSIREYWATCVYFKKSETADSMFKIVKHVFDNYKFYKELYHLPSMMFRNDHAFSIAVHMLNGFEESNMVAPLPIPYLYKSFDRDDIHEVHGVNDISFYVEKPNESGNYTLTRVKNVDVHIMNKWAIIRNSDKLLEIYSEQ